MTSYDQRRRARSADRSGGVGRSVYIGKRCPGSRESHEPQVERVWATNTSTEKSVIVVLQHFTTNEVAARVLIGSRACYNRLERIEY